MPLDTCRGGFFESDDDYCSALVDGGFNKALQVRIAVDRDLMQGSSHVPGVPRPVLSWEHGNLLFRWATLCPARLLAPHSPPRSLCLSGTYQAPSLCSPLSMPLGSECSFAEVRGMGSLPAALPEGPGARFGEGVVVPAPPCLPPNPRRGCVCVAAVPRVTDSRLLDLAAETDTLKAFASFFETEILKNGSAVTLLYRMDGTLDIALSGSERPYELAQARTSLCIGSATLCRALFEAVLGQSSIMPGARPNFAAGARQLLESDNIRRDSRRGGAG